jgi:murein DD-endopeptidase MepM/ murein hydrolase activator NlpD
VAADGATRAALVARLFACGMISAATPAGAAVAGARAESPVELSLPFEGVWGVVQGFDSGETHTGYAAFALDFAPPQDIGRFARLVHPRLVDFACYGRPVLAPADGTVVRVATGFPDLAPYAKPKPKPRPPGRARSQPPANAGSGNFVIIQHAPALFTELVHLQAGSVRVRVGQGVRRGQPVGACGNSGSARTPHLHLGLLTSIDPIATGRMKLTRYEVLRPAAAPDAPPRAPPGDARWTPGDGEPKQGQWVRPAAAGQSSVR